MAIQRAETPHATAAPSYDVFISYHRRHHDQVESIAQGLRQRDLNVCLDRWYLTPGLSWVDKLATVLGDCRAAAIIIGAQGLGRWQQRERDLQLNVTISFLAQPAGTAISDNSYTPTRA